MATANKKSAKSTLAPKKGTASQKIKALEDKLMSHEKNFLILADEIDGLKTVISGLTKRLNATISAGEAEEGISNKSVNDLIVQDNVKELKGKIDFLLEQGVLEKPEEGIKTAQDTFVVGREVDEEGNTVNPRVQFAIGSLDPELQKQLIGFSVGDKILLREGDPQLEVSEIYKVGTPSVDSKFDEEDLEKEENSEVESTTQE